MEISEIIGKNFAQLRQKKNLTQKQIAERIGVHSSYISSFENGHQNPRITTFVKLADGLGVCYFDLLDPKGQA